MHTDSLSLSLIPADETGNTQKKQTNRATIRQTAAEYMQTMVDTHMTNSTIHGQKKHITFVCPFKKITKSLSNSSCNKNMVKNSKWEMTSERSEVAQEKIIRVN